MDPLLVSAFVITLVGAFGRSAMALREFSSATKNTPSELESLLNEVNELNLLLSQIEPLRSHARTTFIERTTPADMLLQTLSIQLQRASETAAKIDDLIRKFSQHQESQPNLRRKLIFISGSRKIRELRDELTDIKYNLAILLSSLNLSIHQETNITTDLPSELVTGYGPLLPVDYLDHNLNVSHSNPHNISKKLELLTGESLTRFLSSCTTESRSRTDEASPTSYSFSDTSTLYEIESVTSESSSLNTKVELSGSYQTKELETEDITSTMIEYLRSSATTHEQLLRSNPGSLTQVATSRNIVSPNNIRQRCSFGSGCTCVCHRIHHLSSPHFASPAIGLLHIRYSASLVNYRCDRSACSGDNCRVLNLKYVLPEWLAAMAVEATMSSKIELLLRFSRRKADKDLPPLNIFECARTGDIRHLRSLYLNGVASPSDQTTSGRTALHYAYASRQLDTCRFLLSLGADDLVRDDHNLTPRQFGVFSLLIENKISSTQALTLETHLITDDKAFASEQLMDLRKQIIELAVLSARIENDSSILKDSEVLRSDFWTNNHMDEEICHAAHVFRQQCDSNLAKPWISFHASIGMLLLIFYLALNVTVIIAFGDMLNWILMILMMAILVIPTHWPLMRESEDRGQKLVDNVTDSQPGPATSLSDTPLLLRFDILGIGSYILKHSLSCEQPIAPGNTRIEWNCPCGCPLKDDFKELDSGALHNLRIFLQQEPSRPSECSPYVADSEADALEQESTNRPPADGNPKDVTDQSSSSKLEGQDPGSVKEPGDNEARGYTPSLSTSSSDTILGDEEEPLAIYACFCFGSYGRAIKHLPVKRGWTDETLIASLAQAYYEKGNSWFTRYCSLWEVRSIRCIKFRLTDHELIDIEKFDHWPGEDHKLDWEYSPFPAPYTPLVSSVYIMHLWQNPLHMSRGAFQKQNTTLRRFLRPFRARGPTHPPGTESTVKKHLYLALSLFVKYRNASMWLCKKAIPSAFLAPTSQRGGDATGSDVESTTGSPTTTCANTKDPESATTSTFQSRSAWFFNGTPKKLHHELQPCFDDDAHPPVGWALFFEEDLSAPPALFWLLTVHILGCLVSLIATGVQMPGLSVDAFFSIPALILAVSTFAYAMVSKNCECMRKSRDSR